MKTQIPNMPGLHPHQVRITPDCIQNILNMLAADICSELEIWAKNQKALGADCWPKDADNWPETPFPHPAETIPEVIPKPLPHATGNRPNPAKFQTTLPPTPTPPSTSEQKSQSTPNPSKKSAAIKGFSSLRPEKRASQTATPQEKSACLKQFYAQIRSCHDCLLKEHSEGFLRAQGAPMANIMFIGAGGNPNEMAEGRFFTDDAATIFDNILKAIAKQSELATPEHIYVTNLIKCCAIPPNNQKDAITRACLKHLKDEIDIVSPKVIFLWGGLVYHALFPSDGRQISQVRGSWHCFMGYPTIATHSPIEIAMLSKNAKNSGKVYELKKRIWSDLTLALEKIKE